ncbi:MAG: phosphoribosylamine--glycine ligase [Deltaproteobacteria bacterium]|nr:phosphoribosylamine--glycine ligase [Deltaproteobacteria bacterium]
MRVLVIGGGGREHALVWKIAQSPMVEEVVCAPGNGGIARLARCVEINPTDLEGLSRFAQDQQIDLTVVGPELPLTMGIVDLFEARGLRIFGSSGKASEIEGSKAFCKELLKRYGIPSAEHVVFEDRDRAASYIRSRGAPIVVKADGLAGGKGVVVAQTEKEALEALDRIMVARDLGRAGDRVVIEACLEGEEASFLAFTDGESVVPMASSQDHKRLLDNDEGPNTGGMGAYSPAPVITPGVHERIVDEIMIPLIRAMAAEGRPYKGVLYGGLMIKDGNPFVLEFNARFGDPEAQPILVRMKSDIVPLLTACIEGTLTGMEIEWDSRAAVCVVLASQGYPGLYEKGRVITGLDQAESAEDVVVFHAGTALQEDRVVTNGGRVLGVTALGEGIPQAVRRAYEVSERITWEGVYYRKDIGARALARLRQDCS